MKSLSMKYSNFMLLLPICRPVDSSDRLGGGAQMKKLSEQPGVFICYMSSLIGKKVCDKLVLFGKQAVEQWELLNINFFEAIPSRTWKNALFAKYNIVLPHAKEKLVVYKSDTLCATSVKYWGAIPLPPVSTGLPKSITLHLLALNSTCQS